MVFVQIYVHYQLLTHIPILRGLGKLKPSLARREFFMHSKKSTIVKQIYRKYKDRFMEVSDMACGHGAFLYHIR